MANITGPEKMQKSSDPRQLRRCSTGLIGNRTVEPNSLPNYLKSTSNGTCHDFCKYGAHKPDSQFKTVERTPMAKGFSAAPQKSAEPAKDDAFLLPKRRSSSTFRPPLVIHENKVMHPNPSEELKQKPSRQKECCISKTKQGRQKDIKISSVNNAASPKGTRNSNKSKEAPPLPPTTTSTSCEYGAAKLKNMGSNLKGKKEVISPAATRFQNRKQEGKTTPKKSMESLKKAGMQHSNDEDVPEKIIHVVETRTQNSKDISSEEKEKQWLSINRNAREGDHDSESPHKLKFKKGKEIEIENEDNGEGRRLKFKPAKLLDNENEHKNAETMVKKTSKAPYLAPNQPKETTNEVDEVVLRHQDPKQTENTQTLYNIVIKKTAKKLVQTKNSNKVKALVNAFETIITLQDDKSQGKVKA